MHFGAIEDCGGPTRPYVGFWVLLSTAKRQAQLIEKTEEYMLPRIPRQQAIDDLAATADDLRRHMDHGSAEGGEVHSQQSVFFRGVFLLPTTMLGQQKSGPGFQAPSQRGHYHVGPVAHKVVNRRRKRAYTALELRYEILLIATPVGRENDLLGRRIPVVSNIEKAFRVVEQFHLPLRNFEILPGNNYAIGFLAQRGRMFELGNVFLRKPSLLEFAASDDLILDVGPASAGLCFGLVFRAAHEPFPCLSRQFFDFFVKRGHGVDAENKAYAVVVPAIEMGRLGKSRVAAKRDLFEARPTAQVDSTVEINVGSILAGAVAATIEDVERFARVSQGHEQGMIAPNAVVGDVHALLALAVGFHHGSVGVDDGLVEELLRLLAPDAHASFVEHLLQHVDLTRIEASAEVARGGRVGDPPCSQSVKIGLVVSQQFEVLQASAAGQQIVGHVEHMVRLVVGQMYFEQLNIPVDRIDQTDLASHLVNSANTSGADGLCPLCDFIMYIACREHRLLASAIVGFIQPLLDSSLASPHLFLYLGTHSKTLLVSGKGMLCLPYIRPKMPMVFEFFNAA